MQVVNVQLSGHTHTHTHTHTLSLSRSLAHSSECVCVCVCEVMAVADSLRKFSRWFSASVFDGLFGTLSRQRLVKKNSK